jgi:hypothetical protein
MGFPAALHTKVSYVYIMFSFDRRSWKRKSIPFVCFLIFHGFPCFQGSTCYVQSLPLNSLSNNLLPDLFRAILSNDQNIAHITRVAVGLNSIGLDVDANENFRIYAAGWNLEEILGGRLREPKLVHGICTSVQIFMTHIANVIGFKTPMAPGEY